MFGIIKLKIKDNKAIKIDDIIYNVPEDVRKFLNDIKIEDTVEFGYYEQDGKKYLKFIKIKTTEVSSLPKDNLSLLTQYKKNNWSLLPIINDDKIPVEPKWSDIYGGQGETHYEINEWNDWLKNGYKRKKDGKLFKNINLGLRTGKVSKISVIDVDDTELTVKVDLSKTLHQITRAKHYHLVYQYDPELNLLKANKKLKEELHIDIRNDGNQVLIEPSKINGNPYKFINLGQPITPIPKELKEQLMFYASKNKMESKIVVPEIIIPKIVAGQRSNTLMGLGGILRNRFSPENVAWILNLLHKQICEEDPKNPLTEREILRMVQSLAGYKQSDEQSLKDQIYNWARMYENDFTARDVMESLTLKNRGIVDKTLSELVKEDRLMRLSRGIYRYKEQVEWKTGKPDKGTPIIIKVPYFNHIQNFESGDIILIGGMPGRGKTHIAMNIIKQLQMQNVENIYYLHKEPQSRFQKIGDILKIDWNKLKYYHHSNPLSVQIEKNAFTILDYLHIRDKSLTDTCIGYLNDEMVKKGGLLFVFVQLKKSGEYFAPNMIDQSPAFACRYLYDNETKISGHFEIDKIREPRGENEIRILPCVFDKRTKILKIKEED